MKALKEKRVSLRSLFRRSLVILSLLALAFAVASCNGSTTGGDEETTPPGGGGNPNTPTKYVKSIAVLDHPNVPSVEGAEPKLDGIRVMVKWSNNGVDEDEIVTDATKFTVYPPVAYVTTAGTHEPLSPYGRYGIQYIDDLTNNVSNVRYENVYIPVVIALSATTDTPIGDKIPYVYEDLGVGGGADGLTYTGIYADFTAETYFGLASFASNFSGNTLPLDYSYGPSETDLEKIYKERNAAGALVERDVWKPENVQGKQSNKVSSNPAAWLLMLDKDSDDDYVATYKANWSPPINGTPIVGLVENVKIDKYYKVNRFEYIAGSEIGKIDVIVADDETYGGNNVKYSGGTVNVKTDSVVRTTAGTDFRAAWVDKLNDAGLRFKVTYYLPGKDNPADMPTRIVTMSDYVRAMYKVTEGKGPRATLPVFTGNNISGQGSQHSSPQNWAYNEGEYNLSVTLFYYSDLIDPATTAGKGDLKYATLTSGTYLSANGATIPISENNLVAQFSGKFTAERKDSTKHDGEPTLQANTIPSNTDSSALTTLYNQIQYFYDGFWWYDNPKDPSNPLKKKIPLWYPVATGLTEWDFDDLDDIEGGVSRREAVVYFPAPPSNPDGHGADESPDEPVYYFIRP